jgi:hypothetical protein
MIQRNHNPGNNFQCAFCNCRTASNNGLAVHMSLLHPNEFKSVRSTLVQTSSPRPPRNSINIPGSSASPSKVVEPKNSSTTRKAINSVLYRCKKCLKTFSSLSALRYVQFTINCMLPNLNWILGCNFCFKNIQIFLSRNLNLTFWFAVGISLFILAKNLIGVPFASGAL